MHFEQYPPADCVKGQLKPMVLSRMFVSRHIFECNKQKEALRRFSTQPATAITQLGLSAVEPRREI